MEVLGTYEAKPEQAPTRQALLNTDFASPHCRGGARESAPAQAGLALAETPAGELDLQAVVRRTVEAVVQKTIDIPRIVVTPKGEVRSGSSPSRWT